MGIPCTHMVTMGYFWSKKLCILPHTFDEGLFKKNIHDWQKKQRTFSLNKIWYHLIFLILSLFPLSNYLARNVFFTSRNNFDMKKYQSKEGCSNLTDIEAWTSGFIVRSALRQTDWIPYLDLDRLPCVAIRYLPSYLYSSYIRV